MLESKKPEVSVRFLKNFALITMVINHLGYAIMNAYSYYGRWYLLLFFLTRSSFCIYAFLVSEGMYKTRDRYKYMFRLALLALLSEVPYDYFCFGRLFVPRNFNIYFTLFMGALSIDLVEHYTEKWMKIIVCFVLLIVGYYVEYGVMGLLYITIFYYYRKTPALMYSLITIVSVLYLPLIELQYNTSFNGGIISYLINYNWKRTEVFIQMGAVLSFPLIAMYKGKKGNSKMPSWFYYIFYPLHLILIMIIVKVFTNM